MNANALQTELDKKDGPVMQGGRYLSRVQPQEPTAKWKSHGRNGRNFETKKPRSTV
jgi:hypothetical protein